MNNITQKTLPDSVCVCVPSHVSHLKHWVWEVCVCPISLCPIYKIEEGGQKVGVFLCVLCPISFFLGVPSNGIDRVVTSW